VFVYLIFSFQVGVWDHLFFPQTFALTIQYYTNRMISTWAVAFAEICCGKVLTQFFLMYEAVYCC
jgi:hypothetical protein